uniref:Uncharacterized protein n=1 Tax=Aegilops tauschii subsp. strangulata TaxID=200361 RepID=A0A452YWV5_AEGTS
MGILHLRYSRRTNFLLGGVKGKRSQFHIHTCAFDHTLVLVPEAIFIAHLKQTITTILNYYRSSGR